MTKRPDLDLEFIEQFFELKNSLIKFKMALMRQGFPKTRVRRFYQAMNEVCMLQFFLEDYMEDLGAWQTTVRKYQELSRGGEI